MSLYPKHSEQFQAYSRCSINMCWLYGQLKISIIQDCSVLVAKLCPTLLRPPWTVAREAPLSLGLSLLLSQARILEGVAISFSRRSPQPRDPTLISFVLCTSGGFCTAEASEKPVIQGGFVYLGS